MAENDPFAPRHRAVSAVALGFVLLLSAARVSAYSGVSHEIMVDAVWDDTIVPLLRHRFSTIGKERITRARAFAYGGAVIQDLGYFPFGSRLFSNLLHYVRSGDFIEALIREARDPDEYAFALGALAHYACDTTGHQLAVNRAVPLVYPKLRARYGDEVIYAESPARHIMVEFAFDVLQIARGAYVAGAYKDRIGFEVPKPLLARAFHATYGLKLKDVFLDEDLAIGTYRHGMSTTIPEMTRLAWEDKQDEIRRRTPGVDRDAFVFRFSRREYEREFGTHYRKPGLLARCLFFFAKILPKVGPLKPLAFEPLTPEASRLLFESFTSARDAYRASLRALQRGRLDLANVDLDTGTAPRRRRNPLVGKTYADLVEELADRKFAGVSVELRRDINRHFASAARDATDRKERKRDARARRLLAALNAGG
jgi:hypothetical protein